MTLIKFRAKTDDVNRTLFKYLIKQLNNVPISKIEKLFRLKDVKVNGARTNQKDYKVQYNDLIEVYGITNYQNQANDFEQSTILFKTIFEDDNILVVEKPINVAIHGEENCLDNQVLKYLKYKKTNSFQPSHIGRLDKATSGLMIYAKTYKALVELNQKTNHFEKFYQLKSDFNWTRKKVILYAHFNHKTKTWFASEQVNQNKMETIFFIDQNKQYAQIKTGKKHQIRMSLQYLNYPVYGDTKYQGPRAKRLYLHCTRIVLHNLENELEYLNGTTFISEIKW